MGTGVKKIIRTITKMGGPWKVLKKSRLETLRITNVWGLSIRREKNDFFHTVKWQKSKNLSECPGLIIEQIDASRRRCCDQLWVGQRCFFQQIFALFTVRSVFNGKMDRQGNHQIEKKGGFKWKKRREIKKLKTAPIS